MAESKIDIDRRMTDVARPYIFVESLATPTNALYDPQNLPMDVILLLRRSRRCTVIAVSLSMLGIALRPAEEQLILVWSEGHVHDAGHIHTVDGKLRTIKSSI